MYPQISVYYHFKAVALACFATLLAPLALCQEQGIANGAIEVEEEIIVHAEKSTTRLKVELQKTERDMYALFNALNDDDKFDVHCEQRKPTGSQIRQQSCYPQYFYKATAAQGKSALASMKNPSNYIPHADPKHVLRDFQNEWEEKMKEAMLKDPKLLELFQEYDALKQEYIEITDMGDE